MKSAPAVRRDVREPDPKVPGRSLSVLRAARNLMRRIGRHVSHPVRIALCDWAASMMIGLMPLLCHAVLHFAAKPPADWDDNWSPDLLFISITNSGVVTVTVFTRMLGDTYSLASMTPSMRLVWGLTIVCFALASMLYGAAVTGMGNQFTGLTSVMFVIFTAFCSLTFELAVAREEEASQARMKPE